MTENNIAYKAAFIVAASFLIQSQPAIAMHASDGPEVAIVANQDVSFTLRGSAGLLNGQAGELVYDSDLGYRRKLSELKWDLKQIAMVGAVGSIKVANIVDINLGLWTAATKGNGEMADYDWRLGIPGTPSLNDWTDRSFSDIEVTKAMLFDINATLKLFKWETLTFKGILGYKQDNWAWSDSGRSFIYSDEIAGFRTSSGSLNGENLIDYEQTFNILYIGGSAAAPIGPFELSGYLLLSPFVSAEDKDYHIYYNTHYTETFSGGTYIAIGGNVTYHITPNLFISGVLDYQSIPEIAGDTTIRGAVGNVEHYSNNAGISHNSLMISGSVGYQF